MIKFRARLTLILCLIIGLSVLAAGLFTAKLMEKTYTHTLQTSMERELNVVNATVPWPASGSEAELRRYFTEKADLLKRSADARVTFIRADGVVLGDSDHDPATMDNHLDREEVQEAANSGIGQSVRSSQTVGQNMLYVAVPVDSNGQRLGFTRLATSLASVEAVLNQLRLFLLGGLIVLFLVAVVVSYRIALGLTRPLESIIRVAKQITHMQYGARVPVQRGDEIGQLGHAINTMADSLQLQMKRSTEEESRLKSVLENMTSGVVMVDRDKKVVLLNRSAEEILGFSSGELLGKSYRETNQAFELTQLIEECLESGGHVRDEVLLYYPQERIVEANVSALSDGVGEPAGAVIVLHDITAVRRLERMRSEFVANVSHELKTPIAAVKGFAETLLAGAMSDPETARSFLQIIYDESERLNRLIGDILELSKIESKRIPLQFSPVEMKPFVEQTLQVMEAQAREKNITLDMRVPDNIFIEADEDRLRQIMINLLSNGISYTPEGGKVSVAVEPVVQPAVSGTELYAVLPASTEGVGEDDHEKVRIIITDTGMGIPKKDQPRIFERFYRVDKARSRSSGGTGLGLSIVKHLVEMHRGTIAVESEVGFGSRFIIELPVIHS